MELDKTQQIDVNTKAFYLPEQSEPADNRFVFAYTITILNSGNEPAKLTHRHWSITDANGKLEEVHGEGVVGEQPHIQPGESYRYTSGAILETPVGAMHGHYDMISDKGDLFTATIKPFSLSVPGSLH